MVGVEVGDEHLVDLEQPDRAHQLALGALAAVEQQLLAAAAQQRGGQAAARRGRGRGGAGEENVEVHGADSLALQPTTTSSNSIDVAVHAGEAHGVRGRPAAVGGAAGVEDLEAVGLLVERDVRVAEHDRVRRPGSGRAAAPAARPPAGRRRAPCAIRTSPASTIALGRQPPPQLVVVDVAVHRRPRAGRSARAPRSVVADTTSPAWRIRSAAAEALDARSGRRRSPRGRWVSEMTAISNAPGRIRTSGLSLRRRALYPLSYGRRSAPV